MSRGRRRKGGQACFNSEEYRSILDNMFQDLQNPALEHALLKTLQYLYLLLDRVQEKLPQIDDLDFEE